MWQTLALHNIKRAQVEELQSLLELCGANGVLIEASDDETIYEPTIGTDPIWENNTIHAVFPDDVVLDKIVAMVKAKFPQKNLHHEMSQHHDQDWQNEWKKYVAPQKFADNLWICPTWCKPIDINATNIMLDPGMAFGTGSHSTTKLCLQWLANNPVEGKTLIDYGCGSGVLAITAAKLGARQVFAIDIDPQALVATKANAEQNNVSEKIIFAQPDTFELQQADIVIANILAEPLVHLAKLFANLVTQNGQLVLSGILKEQIDKIRNAYKVSFEETKTTSDKEWLRIDFTKNENKS